MITHFGWKAILGILTINIATYFLFKKELSELQDVYVKIRRKRQIQRTIIDNKLLELRLEAAEMEVNEELGFIQRLEEKFWQMKSELVREGLDQFSISDPDEQINVEGAIESRFDDVKKKEIKMTIPGLIPKDKRPVLRDPEWDNREDWVPKWIMFVHVLFMAWTVVNAHHPALFIGGFLFFLGFARISTFYQNRIDLKPPLLVGFFLAGLVIHGGVQAWWIAPIIANLGGIPLMLGATFLTSFNDNAAITYLSTLVQGLSPQLKYSVVAGSIAGGGLTIIANAPNPAGQSILKNYFKNGISAPRLLLATIVPTLVIWLIFLIL
ncbi:MAG: putative Na+/H+ antiporter [Candidatus Riflebacteria bacterium]|nr:putative Na+/H+ antiporter [Candidatus Riflebacteria bacterium]